MKKILSFITALSCALLFSLTSSAQSYCLDSPVGYASGVTGGTGKTVKLVSTVADLTSALKTGNATIIVTSNLSTSSVIKSTGSNITLLALPGVTITGTNRDKAAGIFNFSGGSNIIIRNLTLIGAGAYDCDASTGDDITLQGATNVWIDHCDISDGVDGNLDIKSNSDNVTITWTKFHYDKAPKAGGSGGTDDHRFSGLIGSGSSDKPSDGTYNVTFAGCWWSSGCVERMPRVRNALVNMVNNYWSSPDAHYYIGPENAKVYVQGSTMDVNASKVADKGYGGTVAVTYVDCDVASALKKNCDGTVTNPNNMGAWELMTAAASKTAITSSCGAGATLNVTTAGVVSAGAGCASPVVLELTSATGTDAQTVTTGSAITNIQYTASGTATNATITFTGGTPAGLTIGGTALKPTITGTPTTAGTYNYTVTATDGTPANNVTLAGSITVKVPVLPTISIDPTATEVEQGKAIKKVVTVTADNPVTSFSIISGSLPAGLTATMLNSTTYVISGTADPAAALGDYPISIQATNAAGSSNTVSATITVKEPSTCETFFWFFNEADASAAGITNSSRLTVTEVGSGSKTGSITIDAITYDVTKRSGNNTNHALSFTVNTGYVGTLYAILNSSGSSERTIQLLKDGDPYTTFAVAGSDLQGKTLATFLPAGTYTLGDQSGNWGLAMYAFSECLDICTDNPLTITPSTTSTTVGSDVTITPSRTGTGVITYSISKGGSPTTDASITDGKFSATKVGTYTVVASITRADGFCADDSDPITITVACKSQTLSIAAAKSSVTTGTNDKITPTALGSGAVTYTLSPAVGATVTSNNFNASAEGSFSVTADIAADDVYCAATSSPISITVLNKPVVTASIESEAHEVGDAVSFTYTLSNTDTYDWGTSVADLNAALPDGLTAAVSGKVITVSGTVASTAAKKTYTLTASASNTAGSASDVVSITIKCKTQTLTIVPSKTSILLGESVTLTPSPAKTGTGNITYTALLVSTDKSSSTLSPVVSATSTTFTPTDMSNEWYVQAEIAADGTYCSAASTPVNIKVTVNPTPTIAVSDDAQTIWLSEAITPVTFTSSEAGVFTYSALPAGLTAAVSGDNKTLTISGTPTSAMAATTITVSVKGSGTGLTSADYTHTLTVNKKTPVLTLTVDDPTVLTGENVTLSYTVSSYNNSISSVVIKDGATTIATKTDGLTTGTFTTGALSEGTHTFTALITDAVGETSAATTATKATVVVTVGALSAPSATISTNTTTINLGGSFNLTGNGFVTTGSSITNVKIYVDDVEKASADASSAAYTFTPDKTGTFDVKATATDDKSMTGTSSIITLTVLPNKPVLSIPANVVYKRGETITPIVVTADSACTWTVTSLPTGLSFVTAPDKKSITISGTISPSASIGEAIYSVTATTNSATSTTINASIAVTESAKPVLTFTPSATVIATKGSPATTTTITASEAVTYNVAAINAALPTGLTATAGLDGRTLTISGTPSVLGTFNLTVSATSVANSQVTSSPFKVVVNAAEITPLDCSLIYTEECAASGATTIDIVNHSTSKVEKVLYKGTPAPGKDRLLINYQVNDIGTGTFDLRVNGVVKKTFTVTP